jgi:Ca2+-binding EF-hand superfamily protein
MGVNCNYDDQSEVISFRDLAGADESLSQEELAAGVGSFDTNGQAGLQEDEFTELLTSLGLDDQEQINELFTGLSGGTDTVDPQGILEAAGEFAGDDGSWNEGQYNEFLGSLAGTDEAMEQANAAMEAQTEPSSQEMFDEATGHNPVEDMPTDENSLFNTLASGGQDDSLLELDELLTTLASFNTDGEAGLSEDEFGNLAETLGLPEERADELYGDLANDQGVVTNGTILGQALTTSDADGFAWTQDGFNNFAALLAGDQTATA